MSLIYPFKLFEKKHAINTIFSRKNVIQQFIKEDCSVKNCEGELAFYINTYGYECVRLFMLLHPTGNKIILNSNEVFGCWKTMNRIWTVLNRKNAALIDCTDLIVCANLSLEKKKIHTYIAFLMKILKLLKHDMMDENSKKQFLICFKNIFPLMINDII